DRLPQKGQREDSLSDDIDELAIPEDSGALLALLGCIRERNNGTQFSRSMDELPGIDEQVFLLADKNLNGFMNVVSTNSKTAKNTPLHFGQFSLDLRADAFLDGNKLFQRHAALLGSTGSGKSWAVARILEQANQLPDSNIILLDLHGEYSKLTYAQQYRIAGPADLATPGANVLFLPYWLLSFEEMQTLFVERSEFTAHNQTLAIHNIISELKKETLQLLGKSEILSQFTIDSPVPFSIDKAIQQLSEMNSERVAGSSGKQKNGDFHGQFSRLIARLESKKTDRRYGFMYQAPQAWNDYKSLHKLAERLLDYGPSDTGKPKGIKVIN
uniref:ATP-binding protein n=1 Tax=Myxococcus vastator TaxID=2709664 RepID=UPI0013D11FBE